MLRHIAWFSGASISPDASGMLTSPDDVVNNRVLAPAHDIEKLGLACSVFGNLEHADAVDVTNHLQKLGVDIVILGKMSPTCLTRLARAAKHLGCYVICDFGAGTRHPSARLKASLVWLIWPSHRRRNWRRKLFKTTNITSAVISDIEEEDNPTEGAGCERQAMAGMLQASQEKAASLRQYERTTTGKS